ncbi:hypothetical protein LZ30DRAFT_468134 [Colletotrichum cereale]|nr:hypothetical protein LZ30DRAFT_468134 [Colletotrichum cereale]
MEGLREQRLWKRDAIRERKSNQTQGSGSRLKAERSSYHHDGRRGIPLSHPAANLSCKQDSSSNDMPGSRGSRRPRPLFRALLPLCLSPLTHLPIYLGRYLVVYSKTAGEGKLSHRKVRRHAEGRKSGWALPSHDANDTSPDRVGNVVDLTHVKVCPRQLAKGCVKATGSTEPGDGARR